MVIYDDKKFKKNVYINRIIFSFSLIFMMAILPLLLILFSNILFPWRFSSPFTNIIGSILIAIGIFYVFISIGDIYFTGWGTAFIVDPPKRVVKSGVYSQCRHPFYFGFSSYILGLFLINANILLITDLLDISVCNTY